MASRVIMINEGRLVYDGPLDELDPSNKGLDNVFADLTGHGEDPELVQAAGNETIREETLDSDG